jgi:hypothetical protein
MKSRVLSLVAGAAFLWLSTLTGSASAQPAPGRVVTISEVTIVGRIQKPIAAVDVSRIQPKLTLAELRQPFLQRIEEAIYRAPF